MRLTIFLICDNRIQVDILHTLENIALNEWVDLLQITDQILDLHVRPFGSQVVQVSVKWHAHWIKRRSL